MHMSMHWFIIFKMFIISLLFFGLLANLSQCSAQLYQQLDALDARIRELELRDRLIYVSDVDKYNWTQLDECSSDNQGGCNVLSGEQYQKIGFSGLDISKQMQNHCQVDIQDSYYLFQSPRNSYIAINHILKNTIQLYNSQCQPIAQLKNMQMKQIFCDRGLCDDGTIVILTQSGSVVLCTEMRNFTDCSMLSSLQQVVKEKIVGGAVRNKGNGVVEVYIADSAGQIIVLDGQGKLRLTVSVEADSKIAHFLDMHPYPIIISSKGWFYSFENSKYTVSLTKCPYLYHPITKAFMSHPYASFIYAISSSVITKLQFKTQPKACEISHQFYLNQPMPELISSDGLAEYQGKLYIGNKIVNVQQKTVKQFAECDNTTVFNFQQMKNNYRKGFFTIKCGMPNKNKQSLIVLKQKNPQQASSKNNTIIMVVILFLVIFLIFLFLRSTAPNLDYDEQLKYNQNLRYKMQVDQLLTNSTKPTQQNIRKTKKEEKQPTRDDQSAAQRQKFRKDK